MAWLLAPLALLIERVAGYPAWLFNALGHPVTWIGALISWLEHKLNLGESRRLKGLLLLVLVLLTVLAVGLLVVAVTRRVPFGWVLEALLASSLLAQKELGRAVKAVADGLNLSLETGRRAVSHIVGRDPNALDEPGVARAAIESLAESTSDGVVAPLFWLLVGGLPGASGEQLTQVGVEGLAGGRHLVRPRGETAERVRLPLEEVVVLVRHTEQLADGERGQRDDDDRQCHALRAEAFDERLEVRQDAVVESGL